MNRFGEIKTIIFGNLIAKIIDCISVLISNVFSPILIGCSSITYGPITLGQKKILHEALPSEYRVSIPSFFSTLGNLLFAIFSLLFGIFSDLYGVKATLLFTLFISATFTFLYSCLLYTSPSPRD